MLVSSVPLSLTQDLGLAHTPRNHGVNSRAPWVPERDVSVTSARTFPRAVVDDRQNADRRPPVRESDTKSRVQRSLGREGLGEFCIGTL